MIVDKGGPAMAPNRRIVAPRPDGTWEVKKPGSDRASGVFDRQSDAINRDREIVGTGLLAAFSLSAPVSPLIGCAGVSIPGEWFFVEGCMGWRLSRSRLPAAPRTRTNRPE
jgi:hypothetical protein